MEPNIKHFYHQNTGTLSYVVNCPNTKKAVVIDPVLDIEIESGRTSFESADKILEYIKQNKFEVEYILETHAHADHLTCAPYLKDKLGAKVAIGTRIKEVQSHFAPIFNLENFNADGSDFDLLINDQDELKIGDLTIRAMSTPGHTHDSLTYIIGNSCFVGDTIFYFSFGTARCDFPGGSAKDLYNSIKKIFSLGDNVNLYLCHDYPGDDRELVYKTTVLEQKNNNIHLKDNASLEEYTKMRESRDKTLSAPKLLLPSLQVNIRAGKLPEPESNGVSYIKIPLDKI